MNLTDEMRCVLYLACRELSGGGKSYTYHDTIEEGCFAFWRAAGCHRSRDTWVRACRRAREAGLLGPVQEAKLAGHRWTEFHYSASVTDLLRIVGPEWHGIAHGKGKGAVQKPARAPVSPAVASGGPERVDSTPWTDSAAQAGELDFKG